MWHKFQYGDLTLHHELVFKTDLEKQVTLTFSQIRAVGTDDPDILHAIFKNHREVLGNYYNEGIPFGYKNSFKIYKNEDAQAIAYETTSFFRERIKKLEGLLKL